MTYRAEDDAGNARFEATFDFLHRAEPAAALDFDSQGDDFGQNFIRAASAVERAVEVHDVEPFRARVPPPFRPVERESVIRDELPFSVQEPHRAAA